MRTAALPLQSLQFPSLPAEYVRPSADPPPLFAESSPEKSLPEMDELDHYHRLMLALLNKISSIQYTVDPQRRLRIRDGVLSAHTVELQLFRTAETRTGYLDSSRHYHSLRWRLMPRLILVYSRFVPRGPRRYMDLLPRWLSCPTVIPSHTALLQKTIILWAESKRDRTTAFQPKSAWSRSLSRKRNVVHTVR
jgi:hypothetical protein